MLVCLRKRRVFRLFALSSLLILSLLYVLLIQQPYHVWWWTPRSVAIQLLPDDVVDPPSRDKTAKAICHGNESTADIDTFDMYASVVADGRHYLDPFPRDETDHAPLDVIWIPMSHVDPGWLSTVNEYGGTTDAILSNMLAFMTEPKNEKMTFIWAEIVYFERWWDKQSEKYRADVRRLVSEGRLEFVSGSYVMTDEANPFYPVTIDNIVEGHQFLMREFGILPTTVYSIDPFGHSNTVSSLFARAGQRRVVINRIHDVIKGHLRSLHSTLFRWRQFDDPSGSEDLLAQVLPYYSYAIKYNCGSDKSLCAEFDFNRRKDWHARFFGAAPEPITDENVRDKAMRLLESLERMAKDVYQHNIIFALHGDDFRYSSILEWHQQHDNLKTLFDWINSNVRDVNIRFGTFKDYFDLIEKRRRQQKPQLPMPTVSGDFFPYVCDDGDVWTGYYTTRPFPKRQGLYAHHLVRAADLLTAEMRNVSDVNQRLTTARRAVALFQHHDAITGTSRVYVMDDYSRRLHEAVGLANAVAAEALQERLGFRKLHTIESAINRTGYPTLELLEIGDNTSIHLITYNSEPRKRQSLIRVLVNRTDVAVFDVITERRLDSQLEPYFDAATGRPISNKHLLIFRCFLDPLGQHAFLLRRDTDFTATSTVEIWSLGGRRPSSLKPSWLKTAHGWEMDSAYNATPLSTFELESPNLRVRLDEFGLPESIWARSNAVASQPLRLSFWQYHQSNSGAYTMNVRAWRAKQISLDNIASFVLVRGPIRQTAYVHTSLLFIEIAVHNLVAESEASEQLHIDVFVDYRKAENFTELVMRVSGPENDNEFTDFFTDSIGLELHKRRTHPSLSVAANYYPMPTAAAIDSVDYRLTVLGDTPHGATAVEANTLEIMLDRLLPHDDHKGLGDDENDGLPLDLHPVHLKFVVALEASAPGRECAGDERKRHSYLSTNARLAHRNLVYPPVVFHSNEASHRNSSHPRPTFPKSLPSVPCDLDLVGDRLLTTGKRLLTLRQAPRDHSMRFLANDGYSCSRNHTIESFLTAYLTDRLGVSTVQRVQLNGFPSTVDATETSSSSHDQTLVSGVSSLGSGDLHAFLYDAPPKTKL